MSVGSFHLAAAGLVVPCATPIETGILRNNVIGMPSQPKAHHEGEKQDNDGKGS